MFNLPIPNNPNPQPDPEPEQRYAWSPAEWYRLVAYRAAVAARFYNDDDIPGEAHDDADA